MGKKVAVTGRRPESLPWHDDEYNDSALALKNRLKYTISSLYDEGYTDYFVGMARGVDTYVAEILYELKYSLGYGDIRVIACLPYASFGTEWGASARVRFERLLSLADDKIIMSDTCSKGAFFVRNKYMVDNSDAVLAVYDNVQNGGTYNTLMYAKSQSKRIIIEEI